MGKTEYNHLNIDEMETYLIADMKKNNDRLLNIKKSKDRKWEIQGVTNAIRGKKRESVISFNRMLKR
jgi:hypothetical protein